MAITDAGGSKSVDTLAAPTTSWVQVQRLVDPGFLVEIEVVAELP